jgi:hypothetical protein
MALLESAVFAGDLRASQGPPAGGGGPVVLSPPYGGPKGDGCTFARSAPPAKPEGGRG